MKNEDKIDIVFCDDSVCPFPVNLPPMTLEQKKREESLMDEIDAKYFGETASISRETEENTLAEHRMAV